MTDQAQPQAPAPIRIGQNRASQGPVPANPRVIWDDILFWFLIVIFGGAMPVWAYFWRPDLLLLAIIIDFSILAISFVGYIVPMEAPKNMLNFKVLGVILGAYFFGLIQGTFPPLAQEGRFYVWDPMGIQTGVHRAPKGVEITKAEIKEGKLTVVDPTEIPKGYVIQVRWMTPEQEIEFELLRPEEKEFTLPAGATNVSVRLMSGTAVSPWFHLPDKEEEPAKAPPAPAAPVRPPLMWPLDPAA